MRSRAPMTPAACTTTPPYLTALTTPAAPRSVPAYLHPKSPAPSLSSTDVRATAALPSPAAMPSPPKQQLHPQHHQPPTQLQLQQPQQQQYPPAHPSPSSHVEPSLPAACASLLSLRSAYAGPPPPSTAHHHHHLHHRHPATACSHPAPPPSVSPISVISPRAPPRSGSRFWQTVMSATAAVEPPRCPDNVNNNNNPPRRPSHNHLPPPQPERSATPPSEHSVSLTDPSASTFVAAPSAATSKRHAWGEPRQGAGSNAATGGAGTPSTASSRGAAPAPAASRDDESSKMNIPCVVCGVRFRKPGHLNMHWRSVHATSSDAVYPGKMQLQSGVGHAGHRVMAPHPGGVKQDGRVAKSMHGRAYGCPQCDARFRRGSDRNRHMRMVHAKIRPFECKQCGNHFGRKSFLEAHVLTVHEKLRPFRCECGAAFGQRSSLTRHTRKIHGKEP